MREIQDMTLNVSRALRGLDEKLSSRRELFSKQFALLRFAPDAFGLRVTAAPVVQELRIERVVENGTVQKRVAPPEIGVLRDTGGEGLSHEMLG